MIEDPAAVASVFSNPDNLPVEHVTIAVSEDGGVVQQIKAIDPHWVENREFTLYERPPSGNDGADIETWLMISEAYLDDLQYLLSLEYHKFWSTALHHPNVRQHLISFLQEATPPYLPLHMETEVRLRYIDIRKHVLIVYSRLITNRESEYEWMTKEFMGEALYNHFVFTIPVLWDICLQYGQDNCEHVAKIVSSVFSLQKRYFEDCVTAVAFVKESLKYIILQVNKDYDSDEPPNLPEAFQGFREIRRPSDENHRPDSLTLDCLRDLVLHMLDTVTTLRIFVEVYNYAVDVYKKAGLVSSLVQLYEYGIPEMSKKLEEISDQNAPEYIELDHFIELVRLEIIALYRNILDVYRNAIVTCEGKIETQVESFLSVVMDGLAEKLLIRDYVFHYPLHEDLDMITQAYADIDPVKTDYILKAVNSNLQELSELAVEQMQNGHSSGTESSESSDSPEMTSDGSLENVDSQSPLSQIKIDSLISEVKDILPELGEGFILKCLQHYDYKADTVINRILEDNLDEPLRALDRQLPIIPEDPLDQNFLETGIERLNVFDGDEFDIMTRDDVDLSRIHIGKKREKYRDAKELLDDKTDIRKMKERYQEYSIICDAERAMYEDEYDDTYDSDGITPTADDTEGRPFVTPRALQMRTREQMESSSSEEEPAESTAGPSTSGGRRPMDFCQNPEEIRARREANWQARRGKGHRPPPPPKSTDVIGKPKGQGQEKEVLHNREKKEKHKSSRANHNRRQGAQWKRSQGMMPS